MKYSYYDNLSQSDRGDLSDYRHATALYLRNNYRLVGKPKFLYHVVLNVNFQALLTLGSSISNALNKREFNLLVKSADLPNYTVDVATLNQYNRKKLNQTKINFDPVAVAFHDDMAGLTTLLWEAYYRYYYQDPNYADNYPQGLVYNTTPYSSDALNSYRYGLDKSHEVPFFDNIVINQLYTNNGIPEYTSYTLVNPIIIGMQHDRVDQENTNLAESTIRFNYESILYNRGYSGVDSPGSFRDSSHYDNTPGPLTAADSAGLKRGNESVDFFTNLASSLIRDYLGDNINQEINRSTATTVTRNNNNPNGFPFDGF
jgi:hypothetical protein